MDIGTWGLIFSGATLIFIILTWFCDKKLKKQSRILNKYTLEKIKAEEDDKNKAWIMEGGLVCIVGSQIKITFCNSGKVVANNIKFDISTDINISGITTERLNSSKSLASEGRFEIVFKITEAKPYSFRVRIKLTWDDEFGKDRENIEDLDISAS